MVRLWKHCLLLWCMFPTAAPARPRGFYLLLSMTLVSQVCFNPQPSDCRAGGMIGKMLSKGLEVTQKMIKFNCNTHQSQIHIIFVLLLFKYEFDRIWSRLCLLKKRESLVTLVTPCWCVGITPRFEGAYEGKTFAGMARNNKDGEEPKGDLRSQNGWWIFGRSSFQMGFSWDLFFISVWVVDFPASLSSKQESFVGFYTHLCVTEVGSKCWAGLNSVFLNVIAGSSVWWGGCLSGAEGAFHEWWTIHWRRLLRENHSCTHIMCWDSAS